MSTDFNLIFQEKLQAKLIEILDAVGVAAVSVTGQAGSGAVGQVTGGANETVAGSGSQQTHTGASHKNDVSAPELTESYNVSMLQDIAHMGKVNARSFDVFSTALGFAALGSGANLHQQEANVTGHADEEYSARKRATEISLVTVGDAVEEAANDTDRA